MKFLIFSFSLLIFKQKKQNQRKESESYKKVYLQGLQNNLVNLARLSSKAFGKFCLLD